MKKTTETTKKSEKNTIKKEPEALEDFSDSWFSKSICSAQDCTGLIPAMPSSEAELDAYEEMYQFCLARPVQAENTTDTP